MQDVRFTFMEQEPGKALLKADHVWNVPAGTDDVKWGDKHVKVNLAAPATDEDSKATYARWVNDSNWLVAPLKLCGPGTELKAEGVKEMEGRKLEALRLRFKNEGTPQREYVLYIDPRTKLVALWDNQSKPGTVARGTWDEYQTFSGFKLATKHRFDGKNIRLGNIQITMAR